MSLESLRSIMGFLSSSSAVTDLVPKNDIKPGWTRTVDSFPCILITQVAGSDTGYLGYKTATAGSRLRREEPVIQVDIYDRDNMRDVYAIADEVIPLLIVSGACRKDSDIDMFDDEKSLYRKILTFSFVKVRED